MMKNPKNLHAVKGFLAKILAKENINIRHDSAARTASFDVKNRILVFPVWENISDDIYDLLVVHEVGHALETPWDKMEKLVDRVYSVHGAGRSKSQVIRSFHGFFNVLEDVRIDQLQRTRYPGSKINYVNGYREMYEKNFFGTKEMSPDKMMFIDRLNLHSKAGFSGVYVPFTAAERKNVNRAMAAKTFDEAADLAIEFWLAEKEKSSREQEFNWENIIAGGDDEHSEENNSEKKPSKEKKKNNSDKEENNSEKKPSNSSGETESEESEAEESKSGEQESENNSSDEKESEDDSADSGSGEDSGEESESEEEKEEEEDSNNAKSGSRSKKSITDNSKESLPESETDDSFQKGVNSLSENSKNFKLAYLDIPKAYTDFEKYIVNYKVWLDYHRKFPTISLESRSEAAMQVKTFLSKENINISYMIKEFEMRKRAKDYAKTQISKTGVINTNKLHSYMYSEDIFRRNEIVPKGKNHGFVLFIDWSGSMSDTIHSVIKQTLSIVAFCRRLNIPYEVYTFTDSFYPENMRVDNPFMGNNFFEDSNSPTNLFYSKYNSKYNESTTARINNVLSSRMKVSEHEEALVNLWVISEGYTGTLDVMGGTPLNETIVLASEIIHSFKKNSKADIVSAIFLTDGEGAPPPNCRGAGHYIFVDSETKEHLPLYKSGEYPDLSTQNLLLTNLKNRTGANLIGFYITNKGVSENIVGQGKGLSPYKLTEAREMMRTEGFCKIWNSGYDDYYYIKNRKLDVNQKTIEESDFSTGTETKGITIKKFSSFLVKHMDKKAASRVLLREFIKKIA